MASVVVRRRPAPNPRSRCSRRRLRGGKGGLEPSGRRSRAALSGGGTVSVSHRAAVTGEETTVTRQKSFKRLVRRRMDKTGESYTAARAVLLAADEPDGSQPPPFVTSDDTIRRRTGRGWEQWLDLLDD